LSIIDDIVAAIRKAFRDFFDLPPAPTNPPPVLSAAQVARALDDLALQINPTEQLDWRHSVVDLLKLLCLDSSLEARAKLADELDLPGNGVLSGEAAANTELHEAVVKAVAEHRIELPRD
jgi:hypothetical protein